MSGILIIGVGNSLRRDDGAAHVLLTRYPYPDGVTIRIAPQWLPEHALEFGEYDVVVCVDASVDAAEVSITTESGSVCQAFPKSNAWGHVLKIEDLLDLCQALNGRCPTIFRLAIPASDFSFGEGLAEATQQSVVMAHRMLNEFLAERVGTK